MNKYPHQDVDDDEKAQADGLALAATMAGETMSPEEHLDLMHSAYNDDDDGDDDDGEQRGYASTIQPMASHAIERRVKYVHTRPIETSRPRMSHLGGLAAVTAAAVGATAIREHRKALNSPNGRTRIRTRAATQLLKAGGKHATRSSLSYALDYKRERLQGVGFMGHRNSMNASHYMTHHADTVKAVAKKHGVSERAVAHAMAYTAAKNFKRTRVFGKQNTEANRMYHAKIGHQTAREAGGW